MKKIYLMTIVLLALLNACTSRPPQLDKASVDEIVDAMSLEEKVNLVVGAGMEGVSGNSAVIGETKNIVPGAAGTTYPIPRLNIPAIVMADGPAGLRISPTRENDENTYYCTHFPIGSLLASTWDQELVEQVGEVLGNEVLEYGADVLLAPAMNIQRNPLCGRSFEYYSEDPVITGKIAAAYVKGVQSNGVGTSIKHFAANNQESNRFANDARVSTRALREIYLKGFEIAVKESNPWTVMSSYNYLNGVYTSESKELLTTLLRDEWNFKGTVVTDWFGGTDGAAQTMAGNDLLMPGRTEQYESIIKAVENGELDEKDLDRNVKRILEMILETPRFKGYNYSNKPDLKAHASVARNSATEGMVLLKNKDVALPLSDKVNTIALFGYTSYDFIAGGAGSGNVNRAYTVSLLDGLKNAGYSIDENMRKMYEEHIAAENERNLPKDERTRHYMPMPRPTEMNLSPEIVKAQASQADIAIVTIGRSSGEFADRPRSDFYLSDEETIMLDMVTTVFHASNKKVIVILNIGEVIETASWKDKPDAILLAWQPGQEGGNSVVDILKGVKTPSGKLPVTFPVTYEDIASSANFPSHGTMTEVQKIINPGGLKSKEKDWDYTNYEEDIYVGYRYFDSFNVPVSYPFGYGLSYTTFDYSNPEIKINDDHYTVSIDITNTGDVSGKEIVQLYISAPQAVSLNKPEKELKAFAKTKELMPGEKVTVELDFRTIDVASFDENSSSWVVNPGNYKVLICSSANDVKATIEQPIDSYSVKTNSILDLQETISLLKRK